MYEFVCSNVMVVISFSTFSATMLHAFKHKTLIYWRLTLATTIMTTVYIVRIVWLSHLRTGHDYSLSWRDNLLTVILNYTWPYTVLPTLLYTWQYYDLVDRVANQGLSCYAFLIRTAFVATASFGTVITTLLYDLYSALGLWYLYPNHLDRSLFAHYTKLC
jgi:hypothetical protein